MCCEFSPVIVFLFMLMTPLPVGTDNFGCKYHEEASVYDCSYIGIAVVPSTFPRDTHHIHLKSNRINRVLNFAFADLYRLISLDLSVNRIDLIQRFAFESLSNLTHLSLQENYLNIISLEQNCFAPLGNLQSLRIEDNRFDISHAYPINELQHLKNLRELNIDIFGGFNFTPEFASMEELEILKFYGTTPFSLYNDSFEVFDDINITHLSLNMNWGRIPSTENNALRPFHALETFTFSSVDGKSVFNLFFPFQNRTLKYVNISGIGYGQPLQLDSEDLKYLSRVCIDTLTLSKSDISSFPWYTIARSRLGHCVQSLDVSYNPLHGSIEIMYMFVPFFENLRILNMCCITPCTDHGNANLQTRKPQQFDVFFPRLEILDLSENQLTMFKRNFVYNFHAGNLKTLNFRETCTYVCQVAVYGLTNLQNLYISGSNCSVIEPLFLRNMSNLRTLQIQNSHLDKGLKSNHDELFLKGLFQIENLDFSQNQIVSIDENLFMDQKDSLKYLNLSGNLLTEIPNFHFTHAKVVDLRKNKMTSFNEDSRRMLGNMNSDMKVYIGGNPLFCACQTLDFLQWLVDNEFRVADMFNLICQNTGENLKDVLLNIENFKWKCSLKHVIILTSSIASSVIVIVGIIGVIYINRIKVEYWRWRLVRYFRLRLYKHGKYHPISAYKYNVFVCYSATDGLWVRQNIVDTLLSDYNLSVCVYDKDFMIGVPIVDCIIDAVEQSAKVVFVISEAFLKSEWGEFEMEVARLHAIRMRKKFGLIVVLKDDIPKRKMPRQLLRIWYRINCIVWLGTDDEERRRKNQRKLYKSIMRGQDCTSL